MKFKQFKIGDIVFTKSQSYLDIDIILSKTKINNYNIVNIYTSYGKYIGQYMQEINYDNYSKTL